MRNLLLAVVAVLLACNAATAQSVEETAAFINQKLQCASGKVDPQPNGEVSVIWESEYDVTWHPPEKARRKESRTKEHRDIISTVHQISTMTFSSKRVGMMTMKRKDRIDLDVVCHAHKDCLWVRRTFYYTFDTRAEAQLVQAYRYWPSRGDFIWDHFNCIVRKKNMNCTGVKGTRGSFIRFWTTLAEGGTAYDCDEETIHKLKRAFDHLFEVSYRKDKIELF